jgi:hypothetical protein
MSIVIVHRRSYISGSVCPTNCSLKSNKKGDLIIPYACFYWGEDLVTKEG